MSENTKSSGKGQVYFSLQPSEMAIFRAASEIYAAYITSGKVSDGNENAYIQKAIREAIHIAHYIENYVLSDDETDREILR